MKNKINFDGLEAKKTELLKKVNAVKKANYIGTNEIDDIVDLVFEVCEEIEKTTETGEKPTVFSLLAELYRPLVSAVIGSDEIVAESSDLTDEEIIKSVSRSKNFKLGDNAVVYGQVVKILLVAVQSFFVFKG